MPDDAAAASQQTVEDLRRELNEALAREAAMAEVLRVINSAPGDLAPVFDAMLEKAMRLCEAAFGALFVFDDDHFIPAALRSVPAAYEVFLAANTVLPGPGTAPYRFLRGGERSVIEDTNLAESEAYRAGDLQRCALVDIGGARSAIQVPLRKDAEVLGVMTLYRQEVRPFTEKQIALLQNFAAQAVIAMENARLITETREALEQQTATAEVLQVINSSPGDLAPVFDAMLERAVLLCEFDFAVLWTYDGSAFHPVARHQVPEPLWAYLQDHTPPALVRVVGGEHLVHIPDVQETALMETEYGRDLTRLGLDTIRSLLIVPLRKEEVLLGAISAYRQDVHPFSDKQIALLQNFATQAVIAMENARLLGELREALEQQTATSEVLGVINSSPGELAPVFDAMLEKALDLCSAAFGVLWTYDGEFTHAAAIRGATAEYREFLSAPHRPGPGSAQLRLIQGERFVHVADLADSDDYRSGDALPRSLVDLGGGRSLLALPLRKDGAYVGAIMIYRQQPVPFSDKQIALLQNFAAQAVIAMENARLITETREALDQQTATAEVLQVINSSPGDLAPVFDALLEKALTLCGAAFGQLNTYDGEHFRTVATLGVPVSFAEYREKNPPAYGPGTASERILAGDRLVHIADLKGEDAYRAGEPNRRALVDLGGARTMLIVALLKDEVVLGTVMVYRQEVRPFTDKQIALLQNFAAQAVIAMENARLITETREALEQQTATAEVLQVINASPGDLAPVFDAILEKARTRTDAIHGDLWTYDGECFYLVATHGEPEFAEWLRQQGPLRGWPGSPFERLLQGEDYVHLEDGPDASFQLVPEFLEKVKIAGIRTTLMVTLRKEDALLGAIVVYRREVQAFSDKQIALLQNFAAQAVIAMENARLLGEIRQRQAELRVTFDNMADGVAMFDEDLRLAAWNRNFQQIADLPEALLAERPSYPDYLRILTERGELDTLSIDAELTRRLEHTDQELRLERTRPNGQVIEVRRNAVPDGGFVLIYSDITERKRSEAEIRSARDAAEAALRELQAAQSSLIQAQKMAALGQLTAGIAHEIKNPLNFVNNFAGLSVELLDELKETAGPVHAQADPDTRAEIDETIELLTGNLDKIAEHGRRADNIVKGMLEHSRGVTSERRKVDLNNLVEEALNLAYHGARAQDQSFNITLEREYATNLAEIEVVPQEVNRVIINLIGNGFYAATKRQRDNGESSFRPILKVSTRDLGEAVEIRIRDNGVGIPSDIRDKLFQPFFTTKPTGEGTGLGLSISYDIVTQQHGGTIEVDSRIGEFTEFTVRLPRGYRATAVEAAS